MQMGGHGYKAEGICLQGQEEKALGVCDQFGCPHRVLWSSCSIPMLVPQLYLPMPQAGFCCPPRPGVFQIPEVRSTCVWGS